MLITLSCALVQTCQDFGLTIDIDNLVKDVDVDGDPLPTPKHQIPILGLTSAPHPQRSAHTIAGDGQVGFEEFKTILTSPSKKSFKSSNDEIPPEHSLLAALRKGRGGSFLPGIHTAEGFEDAPDSP